MKLPAILLTTLFALGIALIAQAVAQEVLTYDYSTGSSDALGVKSLSVTQLHQNYDDLPHRYQLSVVLVGPRPEGTTVKWSVDCGYFAGGASGDTVEWRYDTPGECPDALVNILITLPDGSGLELSQGIFVQERKTTTTIPKPANQSQPTTPPSKPPTDEGKQIVYDGQQAVLKKGANGVSIVEFPERDDVVVLDGSGNKLGVSTKDAQLLVTDNPANLSKLAGVYKSNQSIPMVLTPSGMVDLAARTIFNRTSVSVNKNCKNFCNASPGFASFEEELDYYAKKSCAQLLTAEMWLDLFVAGHRPNFKCSDFASATIADAWSAGLCNSARQVAPDYAKLKRLRDIIDGAYKECLDGINIQCDKKCRGKADETNAYVPGYVLYGVPYSAHIYICPLFCTLDAQTRQRALLHELTHYGGSTDDPMDDLSTYNLEHFIPRMAELYYGFTKDW